jgi:hydrogenase maturation protease
MSKPRPIRVVGIGSPMGDDAVAWEVVARLRQREWPHDIELWTLEGGQRLLDILDGRGRLILVDALAPAGNPGAIRRFDWPDSGVEVLRPGSTHDLRPAAVLELAAMLGLLPAQVSIHAVEGEGFAPETGLSAKVRAAVGELVRRIGGELGANNGGGAEDRECAREGMRLQHTSIPS